jgi:hypothetical protein
LHGELTAVGFRVWWDRISMPSRSLTFHQEIRDAIEVHDRTIIILGPRAVTSEYVRAEWQYALAADKVVSPVLRLGTYDIVPPELKSLHCVNATEQRDEGEALAEIRRIAQEPPPPVGRPFHVPSPPPHFQPRVDQFTRFSSRFVLDEAERIALPSSRRTIVLQGMAGLGKSVLAASLAKATATRRLFPDGVVWLGFTPEERSPLAQLQDLGLALGDDLRVYDSERRAGERVRQRLEKAAALLVLDNVWWDEQVSPFRTALGRRCQMLATTRDAGLATRLGAELHRLDLLTEQESCVLLADWVGTPPEELPPLARVVADECGRLPFALALAGAMAAGGTAWEDLSAALKAADLAFVKTKFPDYLYTDLLRAQQASLEALLRSDDPACARAAQRYLEISAFRWDRPIPEAAIVTRWFGSGALDEREARETLTTLANKALLRTEGASPYRRVFLHDLQQDFLVARVPDQGAEHAAILQAYDKRYPGAPLAAIDDGYYFDSLFHHLERAGRSADMHALLRREDEQGRNAWWEARITRGQAFGYEADVHRGWRDAAAQVAANLHDPDPLTVALLARYALMIGSIRDALAEVPVALVRSLLAHKCWTPEQALAAARWQPSETSRVEGLAAVLPWLDGAAKQDVVDDALAIIATFPEAGDKARSLLRVAEAVEGEQQLCILREVVALTREDLPANRVEHLKTAWVLDASSTEWLEQAIDTLADVEDFSAKWYIESLAQVAPGPFLRRLAPIARTLEDGADRASALLTIALASPPVERAGLAAEAYEAALHARSPTRIELLARVARWLTGEPRAKAVAEVFASLGELKTSERVLGTAAAVLPALEDVDRTRAEQALSEGIAKLESAGTVSSLLAEFGTRGGLQETAPALVQSLIEPLIQAARRDDKGYGRAQALSTLASFKDPASAAQLIAEEARRSQLIKDQRDRVECLTELCKKLDESVRTAVVERLFGLPAVREGGIGVARELAALMRMATPDQLERASEAARSAEAGSDLAAAFAIGFAHHGLWDRVYEMLDRTRSEYNLGLALEAFPERVPPEVATFIIDAAVATQDAELAAKAIPPLVKHLQGEEREVRLKLALLALDYLTNPHDRTQLAHDLLPELSCEMVEEVRRRLEEKPAEYEERPDCLRSRLAIRLVHCERVKDALKVLKQIEYTDDLAQALAEIASIGGPLKSEFAEWAETVADKAWPDNAVQALVQLASSCGGTERNRLLEKASAIATTVSVDSGKFSLIDPGEQKARALLHVAPLLSEDRRRELLLEAWRLAPKGGAFAGQRVLKDLSPHLGRLSPRDLLGPWQEDLAAASRHRAAVLQELASLPDVVERLGGRVAVGEIVTAVEDIARWWPDAC